MRNIVALVDERAHERDWMGHVERCNGLEPCELYAELERDGGAREELMAEKAGVAWRDAEDIVHELRFRLGFTDDETAEAFARAMARYDRSWGSWSASCWSYPRLLAIWERRALSTETIPAPRRTSVRL